MQAQLSTVGVTNLGNLVEAMSILDRLEELLELPRFTANKVTLWTRVLSNTLLLPGTCPPDINHKLAENPYIYPSILALSSTNMEKENGRRK